MLVRGCRNFSLYAESNGVGVDVECEMKLECVGGLG